jgi:hypothetical protein
MGSPSFLRYGSDYRHFSSPCLYLQNRRLLMINNDRYYEPEDDDSDLLDERIADLMKTDYNPEEYDHFAEGISEAKQSDREAVEMILQQSPINYEALGRKLYFMAYEYMEKFAENHAQEDLSAGYLHD